MGATGETEFTTKFSLPNFYAMNTNQEPHVYNKSENQLNSLNSSFLLTNQAYQQVQAAKRCLAETPSRFSTRSAPAAKEGAALARAGGVGRFTVLGQLDKLNGHSYVTTEPDETPSAEQFEKSQTFRDLREFEKRILPREAAVNSTSDSGTSWKNHKDWQTSKVGANAGVGSHNISYGNTNPYVDEEDASVKVLEMMSKKYMLKTFASEQESNQHTYKVNQKLQNLNYETFQEKQRQFMLNKYAGLFSNIFSFKNKGSR